MAKSTECNCGRDHDAKLSKPKGDYLKSWSDERCKKMWHTLTKNAKVHKMSACMRNASGSQNPAGLCKALAIRVGYSPKREGTAAPHTAINPGVLAPATQQYVKNMPKDAPQPSSPSKAPQQKQLSPGQLRLLKIPDDQLDAASLRDKKRALEVQKQLQGQKKPPSKFKTWLLRQMGWPEEEIAKMQTASAHVRVASIRIRSARTLRRVAQTGKFFYRGWVYEHMADGPAEDVTKAKLPPKDAEPDWMENGYSSRQKEKGPKNVWPEEKEVPTKKVTDAKEPMEAGAKKSAKNPLGPAENVTKFQAPPAELEPDWMENGYSTRKTEKGPKPEKLHDPEPASSKALSDASTPMEVKTGAKGGKKAKLDPAAVAAEMKKIFKAKWLVGELTGAFSDGTIDEFLEGVADNALDNLYGDEDFEPKALVRASSQGKSALKKIIKSVLADWEKKLTEALTTAVQK